MNTLKFQITQPQAQDIIEGRTNSSIKLGGKADSVKTPQNLFSCVSQPTSARSNGHAFVKANGGLL